ncbi:MULTISPECIES: dihydroxyacetone kinase subunit DhaL [unclassified Streptosporangium]|uniref:dihydroxyacetone kinase subunit DhaL n=1 Tax=Streptosporangium sp. NPDC006013 TaxID=3155596 RepID=UPI0033BE9AA1
MNDLEPQAVLSWIERFIIRIDDRVQELTELDRRSGDGDFGTNMVTALTRAKAKLSPAPADAGAPFSSLSTAFLEHSGGTSGPLFGMWFREFALAGQGSPAFTAALLADAARNGVATVRRLGSASVGDRTMVDAMAPAADSLAEAAGNDVPAVEALRSAAEAARAGADSTSSITARRGRASYVGEAALGAPDPGAVAVALFFESADELQ